MASGEEKKVIPVRVAARCRPFNEKEKNEGAQSCVKFFVEYNQLSIGGKMFAYDCVFDPSTSQDQVYEECAVPLLTNLFQGYNATIFAYGQTGSGKTYTMGTEASKDSIQNDNRGIIPRIVQAVFDQIRDNTTDKVTYNVSCSMLEIYEERVIDLLAGTKQDNLPIREANGGVFVQGLSSHAVANLPTTIEHITTGCNNRSKGETAMNMHSSRSHAIFTLTVSQCAEEADDKASFIAKLNLVDLAGSERLKKTQAAGERRKEGIKINEGLLALGNVISSLTEPSASGPGPAHVPYRNSKLTRLLQDSLGGSSHTLMIACISPADTNYEETLSTLRYADRAKRIKNKPVVNQDPKAAEIVRLKAEVADLRRQIALGVVDGVAATGLDTTLDRHQQDYKRDEENQLLQKMLDESNRMLKEAQNRHFDMVQQLVANEAQLEKYESRWLDAKAAVQRLQEKLKPYLQEQPECNGCDDKVMTLKQVSVELAQLLQEPPPQEDDAETGGSGARHRRTLSANQSAADGDDSTDEEDGDAPDNNNERQNRYVERTSAIHGELKSLIARIQSKEQQAEQMASMYDKQTQLEAAREKEKDELQKKVDQLQAERDELNRQLRMQENSKKLSEERRKRLNELEKELTDQRKKLRDLKALQKTKLVNEAEIQKLRSEIQDLRAARVRFIRELRQESSKYQTFLAKKDKELAQLKQKEKRTVFEAQRNKQQAERQLLVFRRKYEEAVSCSRRLQQQLQRQQHARAQKFTEQDIDKLSKQLKSRLEEEFNLATSAEEIRVRSEEMINQRTDLNRQLKRAQRKLDRLAGKRTRSQDESGADASGEAECELREEIKRLKNEVDLRTREIEDMHELVTDTENNTGKWQEHMQHHIRTMQHAKCALNITLDAAVTTRVQLMHSESRVKELEAQEADLIESNRQHERETKEVEKRLQQQIKRLREQCEMEQSEKSRALAFLMSQLMDVQSGKTMSDADWRRVLAMKQELDTREQLYNKLEATSEENRRLVQAANRQGGGKKQRLFPSLSASDLKASGTGTGFVRPPPPIQKTRSSRLSKPPERFGDFALTMSPLIDCSQSDESWWRYLADTEEGGTTGNRPQHNGGGGLHHHNQSDYDSDYVNTPARHSKQPLKRESRKRSAAKVQPQSLAQQQSTGDETTGENETTALNTTFVRRQQEDGGASPALNETYNKSPPGTADVEDDSTDAPAPKRVLAFTASSNASTSRLPAPAVVPSGLGKRNERIPSTSEDDNMDITSKQGILSDTFTAKPSTRRAPFFKSPYSNK